MKKAKLAALSLSAALLLSNCGSPAAKETNPPAPQEGAYVAGTYEASADGRNGPVKVSVTFTVDAIEKVTIVEHAESNGISDPAISGIPEAIVTYQSLGVDVVSGATITSEAILTAVAACVEQAGGDVEALKAVPAGEGEAETLQNATVDVLVVGGGKEATLRMAQEALDAQVQYGMISKGETLTELAETIGVPAETLEQTISEFNDLVKAGQPDEFGRRTWESTIEEGPFYAVAFSPCVHHTMGGLEIDSEAKVLNTEGQVIEGLYAAGEVTGGIHGTNRVGGNAVPDALTFGKIAGENAAKK